MDREKWFWINNIPGIGNAKIRALLDAFGSPEEVFGSNRELLAQVALLNQEDIENILSAGNREQAHTSYENMKEKGVKCVFPYEEEYPTRLSELYDKPNILYYKGTLPDPNKKAVAIVGSRKCSNYGIGMTEEIARTLASYGVDIISGMALGVDRVAHEVAIRSGGLTYGVLAGGPEKCYPRQNYNLYMDILENGGIISEYGIGVDTVPGMFPLRNRIISGLCDAVIVVEAGKKSGSLITTNYALEQNRRVIAVPGRTTDFCSEGCNELIAAGAEMYLKPEQLLDSLGIFFDNHCDNKNNLVLAPDEKMLYSLLLDFTPRSLNTLMESLELSQSQVFTGLLELELKGLIREIGKNFYVRIG